MATNYEDEVKRGQATFGATPTGKSGANAFRAAYERIKAETGQKREETEQSYANAYQQLRNQQYQEGLGAASLNAGMSGGQRVGATQKLGAQQALALGALQAQGRGALRAVDTAGAAAYSNALTEGQQAQQYAQQQEASAFERQKLITSVIRGDGDYANYSKEQRAALLKQLGISEAEVNRMLKIAGAGATAQTPVSSGGYTVQDGYVYDAFGNLIIT